MGWLSALGQSWGQSSDRWEQQRELNRKWQLQQAQDQRDAESHANQQKLVLQSILKNEHDIKRLPVMDQREDQLFGLDVKGKEAGIRRDTLGADLTDFNLGRERANAGREDSFYQWMQQNPGIKPEDALMAAARYGVDASKTAGLSAKLNTDLQREQLRTNAAIQAAALRGPYGRGNVYTQPSDYTESLPEKFRRETATADLKKAPMSMSELLEARRMAAAKEGGEIPADLNAQVAQEWTQIEPKLTQLLADAMPDTVQGAGFEGMQGMSPTFASVSQRLPVMVAQNGVQAVIDNIADDPQFNEDEKEMLRQQIITLASVFGESIDPNYRPKVYREPYGTPAQPPMGFSQRYSTRR